LLWKERHPIRSKHCCTRFVEVENNVKQKTCDPPAIASVNCTLEDQYCHCDRQDGILTNISACAEKSCEEPEKDLFGMLSSAVSLEKKIITFSQRLFAVGVVASIKWLDD
jgi:hypothetical protein